MGRHHRRHHRYSDAPGDPHSPREGFYYAHLGWIFDNRWEGTPLEAMRDFAQYPELVWLNKYHFVPAARARRRSATRSAAWPGWSGASSSRPPLLWHATFTINSLSHVFGTRRYETSDTSRNNWLLALLTLGEGWHNNHHYYMASARQGFFWWEVDFTYYILRALSALGVVWDLRVPTEAIRDGGSRRAREAPEGGVGRATRGG